MSADPDPNDTVAYAERLRASWVGEPPKLRSRIMARAMAARGEISDQSSS